MTPVDEIRLALNALKAFPSEELTNRADTEGDTPLESGKTFHETIDLAEELIETTASLLKQGKIDPLPNPLTKQIKGALVNIATQAQRVVQGNAQPQEFANQVDALHARLWAPGLLHDLEELPGLHAKDRKLESLKNKGRRIIKELQRGTPIIGELSTALEDLHTKVTKAADEVATIESRRAAAERSATEAAAHRSAAEEAVTQAKKTEQEIAQLRSTAKTSSDEAGALKEKVKLFFDEIEKNQVRLEQLFGDAKSQLAQADAETTSLTERLGELTMEIERQLQKATGASLFHAFHARRRAVTVAKWIWAGLSVLSLGFSVWWGIFLAGHAGTLDAIFWVKLGATLPLLAVVVFCLSQYGRERRSEEEYAFKSALSLSLVPYKDLVEGIEKGGFSPEYAKFLVTTIAQIYKAPVAAVDDMKNAEAFLPLRGVEALTKMIERIVNR